MDAAGYGFEDALQDEQVNSLVSQRKTQVITEGVSGPISAIKNSPESLLRWLPRICFSETQDDGRTGASMERAFTSAANRQALSFQECCVRESLLVSEIQPHVEIRSVRSKLGR